MTSRERPHHFIDAYWVARHAVALLALLIAAAGWLVFAALLALVRDDVTAPFDRLCLRLVATASSPALQIVAVALSNALIMPYILAIVLPVSAFLAWMRRFIAAVGLLLMTYVLPFVIVSLKGLYLRQRPLTALAYENSSSYPSGHAVAAVVVYGLCCYLLWPYATHGWQRAALGIATAALIVATGLARMVLQVHYPSDVIGGWMSGVAVLGVAVVLLESLHVRRTAGSPPISA